MENENQNKKYDLVVTDPEAIVVYCGDPRFQKAFGEFVRNELHLSEGKYIPLVIPGGAASLSDPMSFPKEFKVVAEAVDLFLANFNSVKLVVLINHEDCKKYDAMKHALGNLFLKRFGDMVAKQKVDLVKIAKMFMDNSSLSTKVKLYYAKFANPEHTQAEFEEVKI